MVDFLWLLLKEPLALLMVASFLFLMGFILYQIITKMVKMWWDYCNYTIPDRAILHNNKRPYAKLRKLRY